MAAVIKKQYLKLYRGSYFPLEQWYTIDTLVLYDAAVTNGSPDSLANYLNNNVNTSDFEKLNIATFTDFEAKGGYPHGELIDDPAYTDSQYIYVMTGDNNNATNGYPYLGPNKEDGVPQSGNIAYLYFNGTPTQMSGDVSDLPTSQRPYLEGQYVVVSKNYIDLTYRDAYTVKAFYCIIPTTYSTTDRKYHLFRASYNKGKFSVASYSKIIDQSKFDNIIKDDNEQPFSSIVINPYAPNNPSLPNGGSGNYGKNEKYFPTIDKIPNGTTEVNDSTSSMYTRYAMNMSNMSTVGDWFWAEEFGLQVAKTAISLLYGDPIQTVISCVSFPFEISSLTGTSSRNLRWGGHDTGISMTTLNNNAFQINWGSITIKEYWGNFLDYSPHTKFQLYLPWGTGFVDIDPNDVMKARLSVTGETSGSGVLKVVTNVEVSRGLCVHNVIANDTVIGSYSGSCGRQIPITGSDYASKQVAVAGAAIGAIAAGGLTAGSAIRQRGNLQAVESPTGRYIGGPKDSILRKQDAAGRYHDIKTGRFVSAPERKRYDVKPGDIDKKKLSKLAANASTPAIASAASLLVSPPHVSRSGSFQEGAGSLTIQEPYLIISRPKMSLPQGYGNHYGYPSNMYFNLGSLRGYTEIASIHLNNISATYEELNELEELLKGGVVL